MEYHQFSNKTETNTPKHLELSIEPQSQARSNKLVNYLHLKITKEVSQDILDNYELDTSLTPGFRHYTLNMVMMP